MSSLNTKGALLVCLTIVLLFGGMELYGLKGGGDRDIITPTIICQLLAITAAVAPMMYGFIWASHHEEDHQ